MKDGFKIIIGIVLTFALIVGVSYASGWIGVHQTKTIEKAQQNADREVFEQSQSYVEGKRQAALKYYKEYMSADDSAKKGIASVVSLEFANFDESKLPEKLRIFVYNCKYNSQ